ncbi:MAG: capsular biosynthesis protein [Bacteroidales bacterium]|nr:capsular biosynthesis protein [Bacteroidales bacterium]
MLSLFGKKYSMLSAALLEGATDAHSHILFGVDDGVGELEESLAILAFCEDAGMKAVWFTPHIMEDVPNKTEDLKLRFEEVKSAYKGSLELHLAAEYMLDTLFEERLDARDLLMHGEGFVLVETSTWAPPIDLWGTLEKILAAGYRPILAHPERYRYMGRPEYRRLASMDVRLQLNIPSIVGSYGDAVREKARFLLRGGYYSMAGSDCHRGKSIKAQYAAEVLEKKDIRLLKPLLMQSEGNQ